MKEKIFISDTSEYQREFSNEANFVIDKLIQSNKYIDDGVLNCTAEDIFMENLFPLQKIILALYRDETSNNCLYYADQTFSDKYLLMSVTLRIIDIMLYEARNKSGKSYFLTWSSKHCHDMDEWVAIVHSKDELKKAYKKEREKEGTNYQKLGLELMAFEFIEDMGFVLVTVI